MPGGRNDALPCAVGIPLDVATGAYLPGHWRVRPDLLGPEQHPFGDLGHLRHERLVVTVVAAELRDAVVLALLEAFVDLVMQSKSDSLAASSEAPKKSDGAR